LSKVNQVTNKKVSKLIVKNNIEKDDIDKSDDMSDIPDISKNIKE